MKIKLVLATLIAALLVGCGGPPPPPEQEAGAKGRGAQDNANR